MQPKLVFQIKFSISWISQTKLQSLLNQGYKKNWTEIKQFFKKKLSIWNTWILAFTLFVQLFSFMYVGCSSVFVVLCVLLWLAECSLCSLWSQGCHKFVSHALLLAFYSLSFIPLIRHPSLPFDYSFVYFLILEYYFAWPKIKTKQTNKKKIR